jgi:hypothetical protein
MKPIESALSLALRFLCLAAICVLTGKAHAQSADWQRVIYREPQVRYLLADICMGGNASLYRKYAIEEKDPDSREAIRLFDAGARVVNTNDFERKWVDSQTLITRKGSDTRISGMEVTFSSDANADKK